MISKADFNKVWNKSTTEDILNQFYYEHNDLRELLKENGNKEEVIKRQQETIDKAIEYNNQIIKDIKDFYRSTTDIIYSGDCIIDIAKNNINILQNGSDEK